MANYTAADIKNLREKTGAGMLDVKKALDEANGDMEKAEEIIRIKGLKGIAKREDRKASAGLVATRIAEDSTWGVAVEVNSETDFVGKNEKFLAFAEAVLEAAVASKAADIDALRSAPCGEGSVQDAADALSAVVGEKIVVSKVARVEGEHVESYLHRTSKDLPPQVAVLIATDAPAAGVAHDIALHIAAYSPQYIDRDGVPAEKLEQERRVAEEVTRAEGKPEAAIAKIVEGRLGGFYKEVCLVDQAYSKDPKTTVGKVLEAEGGKVTDFKRIRVGA